MVTFVRKSSTFIVAFLFLALLLPSMMGLRIMEERLYLKLSGTWKGPCIGQSAGCAQQCQEKEGAIGGECWLIQCYCRFKYCGITCERPSNTWSGACFLDDHCNQQCKQKENAIEGGCNAFMCICKVDC